MRLYQYIWRPGHCSPPQRSRRRAAAQIWMDKGPNVLYYKYIRRKGIAAMNKREGSGEALTGIYQATSRGFGFLVPEHGGEGAEDCFIPPRAEGGAWHGDRVAARLEPGEGQRRCARVTAVLERANRIVTGVIRKHNREVWLQPDRERLPGPIQVLGKARGVRAGDRAAVAMTSFGSAKHPPMGTLREVFGPADSRESAVAAILYEHEIDREFPAAVRAEAQAAPAQVEAGALSGRLDLRETTIITIDGASAKDLDDAVSLERDRQGRWVLGVHIADVSHYVTAGSALDQEAWERGTSVYFADQVVPMLPPELSNGICSLNPRVDRLTLSCVMTLTAEGEVVEHTLAKSVIRTTERMTYEDCNRLLDREAAGENAALRERYAGILPMLEEMAVLAGRLAKRRHLRGSLDLESRESVILCDGTGAPVEVAQREPGVSEALIESFMLAANECVAQHLARVEKPAVYRVHEKPSLDKTESLKAMLAPLGYDLKEADNFSLQKLLDGARGRPEAPAVANLVLRSMMKARYDTENLGHFGLAAPYYCHFTSPIRRYPDLMVHRILTALLEGRLEGAAERKLAAAAGKAARQSSERELAAQTAEREIEKRYLAEYMRQHVGERFPGAVSGVTRFGLFVMLANGVEGLLPAEALPGSGYHYDENRQTLSRWDGGQSFTFGMPLEILCVSADPASGQIDFRLAGEEGPAVPVRRERKERPLPGRTGANRRAMHVPKGRKGRKKR